MRPWVIERAARQARPIALNVRLGGDFPPPPDSEEYELLGPVRTPIWWFVSVLRHLRRVAGGPIPAVCVSNGTAADLELLLREPAVTLATPAAASDLMTLSRARVLIASGGSSFSAWGSFLSSAHTVTFPGQDLKWFGLVDTEVRLIRTLDTRKPDTEFLETAGTSLMI